MIVNSLSALSLSSSLSFSSFSALISFFSLESRGLKDLPRCCLFIALICLYNAATTPPNLKIRVRLREGVGCGLIKPTWAEYGPSAQQPPPSAHKGGCPMTPYCEAMPTNCRHISYLSFGKVFVNMSAPLSSV